ncbi:hypothetical protein BX265_0226 [Streptomyces sp. TLI_235]|nr:hypothetical protein [Streptomyces sp. TLI_235]PBC75558.1 hypothetical protein BX265_0226 [Streptomyces sp. TLI_235]
MTPWHSDPAVELLRLQTGAGPEHDPELTELATRLRRLPLALRLAGRHVHSLTASTQASHREGIAALRTALDRAPARPADVGGTALRGTVGALCESSLDHLEGQGLRRARPVLALLCLCAAEPVPEAFLKLSASAGTPVAGGTRISEEELERTVAGLREIGLAHGQSFVTVDPLVREAMRVALDHEPAETLALHGCLIDMLESAVLSVDPEDPAQTPWWPALAPHLCAACDHPGAAEPGRAARLSAAAEVLTANLRRHGHVRTADRVARAAALGA